MESVPGPRASHDGKAEAPAPFLKWAGGKQAQARQLLGHFPSGYERYFEPFLGGGSVFFAARPSRAVLSDANAWLVDTYRAVRADWRSVAAALESLKNTREDFLRIRSVPPPALEPFERAAQFIYLNKTCFRGLFRVNRKGEFNVPYGAYSRRYYDPDNLASVARALESAEIRTGDFEVGLDGVAEQDFVYFDPPYYKLGGFSDFNRYTSGTFSQSDHIRLAAFCRELDSRGTRWAQSNSDTEFIQSLYSGFRITYVAARREINLSSAARNIRELLITNYPSQCA